MERFTKKNEEGNYDLVKNADLFDGESAFTKAAILRLASYEDMYENLVAEQDRLTKELEVLKAAGKTKTVTFRQLMTKKLTNSNILSYFEVYGR